MPIPSKRSKLLISLNTKHNKTKKQKISQCQDSYQISSLLLYQGNVLVEIFISLTSTYGLNRDVCYLFQYNISVCSVIKVLIRSQNMKIGTMSLQQDRESYKGKSRITYKNDMLGYKE